MSYLKESGDGESCDATVDVSDQVLKVKVAGRHSSWVLHGNLIAHNTEQKALNYGKVNVLAVNRAVQESSAYFVERPGSSVTQSGFWRAAKQLQHGDGRRKLLSSGRLHADDGMCRFVDDHLALVTQARLNEVEERVIDAGRLFVEELRSNADEEAVGVWRLEALARELRHEFGDGESVGLADVVEQSECVVLNHDAVAAHCFLCFVHPTLDNVRAGASQVLQEHRIVKLYTRNFIMCEEARTSELTRAALETACDLSTMACLRKRSML